MRIAMLAPVSRACPPPAYGPWELVAHLITEGLVARGVDVTLFATLDSHTSARLDGVCPRGYWDSPGMDGRIWEALHIGHCLERSGDFDLVHNHLDWLPLAFAGSWKAPLLTTIHGFSSPVIMPCYHAANRRSHYVSISMADRAPGLDYVGNVYHGIDLTDLPRGPGGDALVAFGRVGRDKGTADAIEIARRAGRRLIICGILDDPRYFHEKVAPHIDGDRVIFLGNVGPARRREVLGQAAALLHPVAVHEAFGLAVVEAMACGTPVLAYPKGSMPEVVDVGVTGFLVKDVAEAAEMVEPAARLDRAVVRATAERRFDRQRMVDEYLAVYRKILTS